MIEKSKKPPILTYRQDKNLVDTLVHGEINKKLKHKYNTCSCRVCNAVNREEIWSSTKDTKYKTAKNVSDSDRNVIYALICCECDKAVYVDVTERMLKEQIDEYHLTGKPIMRHFEGHKSYIEDLT